MMPKNIFPDGISNTIKDDDQRRHTKLLLFSCITLLILSYFIAVLFINELASLLSLLSLQPYLLERRISSINSGKTHANPGCEGTVMLMRHCEKQSLVNDNQWTHDHCNYVGSLRAQFLPTLFGNGTTHRTRWPSPSYLYALSPERKNHNISRQIETLLPLSNSTQIPIISRYRHKDSSHLIKSITKDFKKGTMCDKLAIICWSHHDIPKLAQLLGCNTNNGCPIDYDSIGYDEVWQIRYNYTPKQKNRKASWEIFGTVFKFGFDPLMFSKALGNYRN